MNTFNPLSSRFLASVSLESSILLLDSLRFIVEKDKRFPVICRDTLPQIERIIGAAYTHWQACPRQPLTVPALFVPSHLLHAYDTAAHSLRIAFYWKDYTDVPGFNPWGDLSSKLSARFNSLSQEVTT